MRDNLGRIKEIMKKIDPTIGHTVVLTLDLDLQGFCNEISGEQLGVIGVVDLDTGGLLALVSKPNFNPEFLSGPISHEDWIKIVNDPANPLTNSRRGYILQDPCLKSLWLWLPCRRRFYLHPGFLCVWGKRLYTIILFAAGKPMAMGW